MKNNMEFKYLLFEVKNNVGIITFDREYKLNAINGKMFDEIFDALDEIANNKEISLFIICPSNNHNMWFFEVYNKDYIYFTTYLLYNL